MQNDVTAATKFVEEEVRRLLSGNCEAWEMVMTVCKFVLNPGSIVMQMLPFTDQQGRLVQAMACGSVQFSILHLCLHRHRLGHSCLRSQPKLIKV